MGVSEACCGRRPRLPIRAKLQKARTPLQKAIRTGWALQRFTGGFAAIQTVRAERTSNLSETLTNLSSSTAMLTWQDRAGGGGVRGVGGGKCKSEVSSLQAPMQRSLTYSSLTHLSLAYRSLVNTAITGTFDTR
jgi:hypothetical protein